MAESKFHHEEIYRGSDLLKKLNSKHLVVCGCGAIGSNLIDMLIRQGFGNLDIIDKDRVETHNLNTQIFTQQDIGALKAAACQTHAYKAVGADLNAVSKELTSGNAKKLLKKVDLVVDAFDNNSSRLLLKEYCESNKIRCLHAGMHTDYGEVIWNEHYKVPEDSGEDVCDYPLARNLISLVVAIASEEIVNFSLEKAPRFKNWSVTLKDLSIREMKF